MEFSSSTLELGRLYFERGDILKAIKVLEPWVDSCVERRDYEQYLESIQVLLRAYAESLQFDKIEAQKNRLLELTSKQLIQMSGKIYYVLALCASYKNDHEQSLAYSQQALAFSLQQPNNKESVCLALLGLAISYSNLDRLQESLKEIYNLQVFMGVLDLPQVRLSVSLLKARILRKMQNYDQALEVLWDTYETLKTHKHFSSYLSLLYSMALTYKECGRFDEARSYLRLITKSIDKDNMVRLAQAVEELAAALGDDQKQAYDLVFRHSEHMVVEKKKGRIDFNNQFILMDLLRLFLNNPGTSFSKEQLVKHIWKQSYNPAVHDNKIYVTIKRLRQLIEPEIEKPKYIFRSKYGYYFNKDSKILIEEPNKTVR